MSSRALGKVYLGDSVYVEVELGMFKLTTENGFGPTNTIYLEPEVFEALKLYVNTFEYVNTFGGEV